MAGKLSRNQVLFNTNVFNESKATKLYRIRANEYADIDSAGPGDIIAIGGLAKIRAGDNLVQPGSLSKYENRLVKGFELREPLFHASLEFEKNSDKDLFTKIIENYLLEDPSLRYKFDKETGQYVLSGLGELHIETKLARIKNEHGLKISIGKINVAFKEMVTSATSKKTSLLRRLKGSWKYLELELEVEPLDFDDEGLTVEPEVEVRLFDNDKEARKMWNEYIDMLVEANLHKAPKGNQSNGAENDPAIMPIEKIHPKTQEKKHNLAKMSFIKNPIDPKVSTRDFEYEEGKVEDLYHLKSLDFEFIHLIQKTLQEMTASGPLMYSPLVNTRISIVGGQYSPALFDPVILKMTAVSAYSELLAKDNVTLLEPMVEIHITTRNNYVNEVINNAISKRGGRMGAIESADEKETTFTIVIPLLSSTNYASYIRSLTSGEARFTIRNKDYARIKLMRQQFLCENY